MSKINRTVLHNSVPTVQEFKVGGVVRTRLDVFTDGDSVWVWRGDVPKHIPPNSTPETTGGVGNTAWSSLKDTTIRSELLNGNGSMIGVFPNRTLQDKLEDFKTVQDAGILLDGTVQTLQFQQYLDSNDIIIIPSGKSVVVDADIKLRIRNKIIQGSIVLLNNSRVLGTDAPVVSGTVQVQGNFGSSVLTCSSSTKPNVGDFVFLSNNRTNLVERARSAEVGTVDVFASIIKDDVDTTRKCWYKVVRTAGDTLELDRPLLFSVDGSADVSNALYSINMDIKLTSSTSSFEKQSLILANSYGSVLTLRDSTVNSVHLSYYCANNTIAGCSIISSGGLRLHHHCDSNLVLNNTITHLGNGDGAVVVYDNSCRNIIMGNSINGDMTGSHDNFSVVLHTNSDSNLVSNNTLVAHKGASDYMFNKYNKFVANTVHANEMLASSYCLKSVFIDNHFINVRTITSTGSRCVQYSGNEFMNQYKVDTQLLSTYDSGNKPFNIAGFKSEQVQELKLSNNYFEVLGKVPVDFRNFVNFTNPSNNFLDFDSDFKRKQVCVGSVISSFRSIKSSGNTFKGYNCVYMLINGSSALPSSLASTRNEYQDCDVGLVARISNIGTVPKNRVHKLASEVFHGDVYVLTGNYPVQISNPSLNCTSGVYYCGDKSSIYASLVSKDRIVSDTCSVYDFSGNQAYYVSGLIPDGKHLNAKFMDIGFEYRLNGYVYYLNQQKFNGTGSTVKITPNYTEY